MKITNKEEFAIISNLPELKGYLENKAKTMSEEYDVDYFEAIGCFVILDVLVHKLDRFSRNRYDSAIYKSKLKKNKD